MEFCSKYVVQILLINNLLCILNIPPGLATNFPSLTSLSSVRVDEESDLEVIHRYYSLEWFYGGLKQTGITWIDQISPGKLTFLTSRPRTAVNESDVKTFRSVCLVCTSILDLGTNGSYRGFQIWLQGLSRTTFIQIRLSRCTSKHQNAAFGTTLGKICQAVRMGSVRKKCIVERLPFHQGFSTYGFRNITFSSMAEHQFRGWVTKINHYPAPC